MPPFAIEAEDLGRIYKIRGTKKEKAIRKELVSHRYFAPISSSASATGGRARAA